MGELYLVKGASASGKSTRYLYLIRYLKSIGLNFATVQHNGRGKLEDVGIICEELKLFFLGRISNKTGLWRGLDDSLDVFGGNNNLFDFIKTYNKEYSFCIEGSSVTRSDKFRPQFLLNSMGYSFVIVQYYNFVNKQEFIDRKFVRSGKVGENGWDVNDAFLRDMSKALDESKKFENSVIFENNFDEPVYDIGVKIFVRMNLEFMIDDFINYCELNFKK